MIPQPIDTVPLFQRLSEEERQLVTARLQRHHCAPDEVILSEGQPSNALFIVNTGWVKLESGSIDHSVTLANLGAGSLLGEVDTLLDRPCSMTARSAANTQLLSLTRTDLEELIHECPSIGLKFSATLGLRIAFLEKYLTQQRLRNVQLLNTLNEDDLRSIAEKMEFRTYSRGDLIIEAGASADAAFLIEEGHVRLIAHSKEGESFEDLSNGVFFGHMALLTGKPYAVTARAITDLSVWFLSRSAYLALIKPRPAIKLAFSRALAESLSPDDQMEAIERMQQLQLFNDVPTEALSALTARLVLRQFPADEAIYTEGTQGDAMYIIESGEVRLMDGAFADAHMLERVRTGDSFGEMALLTGRTRAECARAATDSTVWVLYKSDFEEVMTQYPEISVSLSRALTERLSSRENDFVVRHLRRIHLFNNLAASELKAISGKLRGLRFRPGEIVCFAGQQATTVFLIEKGEIKRMTNGLSGEPIVIDILDEGDSFGEQDIVQNSPYSTTAQALGEAELWTISKNDFLKLMEEYPALALNVTRIMTDRLKRVQQQALPQSRPPQPRGGMPTSRTFTTRPLNAAPPPGRRFQQPPSGARPINPAPQKPVAAPKPVIPPARPAPGKPQASQPVDSKHSPSIGRATFVNINATRPHNAQPTQSQAKPTVAHVQSRAPRFAAPAATATAATTAAQPTLHVRRPATKRENMFFKEFGEWAMGLSAGAKLRVLAMGLLVAWLALIAMPIATISTVSSAVAGLQISNSNNNAPVAQKAVAANDSDSGNSSKVAFAVPTNTPVPTRTPQPTFTPRPTLRPTLIPVTRTPKPPTQLVAMVAPTAAPTLPPIEMDPRLGSGPQVLPHLDSVQVTPANVAHGQKFWRAVKVKFEDITESGNDHTIYVKLIDENGKRVEGRKVHLTSVGGLSEFPDEKPAGDLCDCNYNYPMYGDGYAFNVEDGLPSDKVSGMIMPMRRHVNYRITFQLVTMP